MAGLLLFDKMKFTPGIGNDILERANLVEPTCMNCGKESDITELIWTEDEESYKGYEVWVYCKECDCESFKIIS